MGYVGQFESLVWLNVLIALIQFPLIWLIVWIVVRARIKPIHDMLLRDMGIILALLQKLSGENELQIKEALTKLLAESELVKYLQNINNKPPAQNGG